MNPERAQMLREIRCEFIKGHCASCPEYNEGNCELILVDICTEFVLYLEDLFAEAESQTEPENENAKL